MRWWWKLWSGASTLSLRWTPAARPNSALVANGIGPAPVSEEAFSRVDAPSGWTFDAAVVERGRTDMVVVEIVERRFNARPLVDPGTTRQFCPVR